MKTRIRKDNPAKDNGKTPRALPPTSEEIRQRAHEFFLARGGIPGKELEDWMRAEQELNRERSGNNVDLNSAK